MVQPDAGDGTDPSTPVAAGDGDAAPGAVVVGSEGLADGQFAADSPSPQPARRRRRWWKVASATVLVVVIVIALVVLLSRRGGGSTRYATAWAPGTQQVADFVATDRGTTFAHPVPIEFLSSAAFNARFGTVSAPANEKGVLGHQLAVNRALGLEQGDLDLSAAVSTFQSDEVIGFYDPPSGHVFVRGQSLDP